MEEKRQMPGSCGANKADLKISRIVLDRLIELTQTLLRKLVLVPKLPRTGCLQQVEAALVCVNQRVVGMRVIEGGKETTRQLQLRRVALDCIEIRKSG